MSTVQTTSSAHNATVNLAESAKQSAAIVVGPTTVANSVSKAATIAADTTFHRAAAKSAIANGLSPSVYMDALRGLGMTLYT